MRRVKGERGTRALSGAAVGSCPSFAASIPRLLGQPGNRLADRHRAEIAILVGANGGRAALLLAVADDEHERRLGELRVADLLADRLGAIVDPRSQAGAAELA